MWLLRTAFYHATNLRKTHVYHRLFRCQILMHVVSRYEISNKEDKWLLKQNLKQTFRHHGLSITVLFRLQLPNFNLERHITICTLQTLHTYIVHAESGKTRISLFLQENKNNQLNPSDLLYTRNSYALSFILLCVVHSSYVSW